MAKPHEETWSVSVDPESNDADRERARLAAQAPAMARMLLKAANNDDAEQVCIGCGNRAASIDGEEATEANGWIGTDHLPTCALIKLLKDAGVL